MIHYSSVFTLDLSWGSVFSKSWIRWKKWVTERQRGSFVRSSGREDQGNVD